jgi:hypothetical protein
VIFQKQSRSANCLTKHSSCNTNINILASLVSQWDEHYKYVWKYLCYYFLLICNVFNDDVSDVEYIVLNDWRSNELEMMWNEADVA